MKPNLVGCFSVFYVIIILFINDGYCLRRQKRIVGGIHAAAPPEDDPVVFVNKNNRDAQIYGGRDPNKGFYVFKGIRFGEPPVGRGRFQRPKAIHLEGEYNATTWGSPCPQEHNGKIIGSEDCLYLNVFTPALPDSGDGYPVLIWIHGGGFRLGAACQYEMRNLIKKRMVVVSIQYRLGTLGFLSVGAPELPGNNGMFDMILAVKWVKQYIEYFGGNPKNIVAFGQGTGASAALMLSLSKLIPNYFSGLIAMSGSLLSNFALEKDAISGSRKIASNHDCPTDNITNMIHCLQELPIEKLVNADTNLAQLRMAARGFVSGISALLVPGPVVEGRDDLRAQPNFMTDTPENFLNFGKFPSIPLLTGVMKDETGGSITGGYRKEVVNKLKTVPNFLQKELVTTLQGTISTFGNVTKQFIPHAFNKYLGVSEVTNNLEEGLKKVTEAVNDAIFNAPAFLTVKYWSKKAKTFFYSFDIKKTSRKNSFLHGLPLVDARNSSNNIPGHGDDLGYVFGENDILGNRIEETHGDEEDEVTETFTGMIAQFARSGDIGNRAKTTKSKNTFESTDSSTPGNNGNSYFSITDKIQPMEDFKICEMGLWTGAIETISAPSCDAVRVTTETVERLAGGTKQIQNLAGSSVDKIQDVGEKVIPPLPITPALPSIPKGLPKFPKFGFIG